MEEDITIKELYSLYLLNLKGGIYAIPPLITIYNILKMRYSPDRVNILNYNPNSLSKVYNIFLDNLNIDSLEFFTILYESYEGNFSVANLQEPLFIILSPCFQSLSMLDFLIWYPSITITNSKNQTHKIKDLYVKLSISNTGNFMGRFTITKSSYTIEELYYPYKHSHIPNFNINREDIASFQRPCLGQGSIGLKVSNLLLCDFEEELFLDFLLALDDFIVWESLEGVPYRYINRIGDKKNYIIVPSSIPSTSNYFSPALYDNLVRSEDISIILEKFCSLLPSIKEDVPYFQIHCDYFEAQKYIAKKYSLGDFYFIEKDIWGKIQYYTKGNDTELLNKINQLKDAELFYFGRQKVVFKLITSENPVEEVQLKIYPFVLHYIINKIEQIFNFKYAKNRFKNFI